MFAPELLRKGASIPRPPQSARKFGEPSTFAKASLVAKRNVMASVVQHPINHQQQQTSGSKFIQARKPESLTPLPNPSRRRSHSAEWKDISSGAARSVVNFDKYSKQSSSSQQQPCSQRHHHTQHHHHSQHLHNQSHRVLTSSSLGKPRKSVGHYVLGDTIGEGTFGKVKRGTHILTGETVAIKILEKSKIKTEADLTRVTREIHILKRARHENCIRLLEVIDTPTQIFLMMEYLDGGEVFDYIVKKSRLPEREASEFFAQILDGVDYLHSVEVIHRDLKPENLLMQRVSGSNGGRASFVVKVADFGLSNVNEGQRLLTTACGSPCYAAPEMIAGEEYDGRKSDIWSLGVVLFALVCGFLPFEDDDTPRLYRKILSASYKCPSFVSKEARDLIAKILDTDPQTRFSIADVKEHPWMKRYAITKLEVLVNKSRGDSNASIDLDQIGAISKDENPAEAGGVDTDEESGVDERIVQECVNLGIDRVVLLKNLGENLHNSSTASYYLISERIRRSVAAADIVKRQHRSKPSRKQPKQLKQSNQFTQLEQPRCVVTATTTVVTNDITPIDAAAAKAKEDEVIAGGVSSASFTVGIQLMSPKNSPDVATAETQATPVKEKEEHLAIAATGQVQEQQATQSGLGPLDGFSDQSELEVTKVANTNDIAATEQDNADEESFEKIEITRTVVVPVLASDAASKLNDQKDDVDDDDDEEEKEENDEDGVTTAFNTVSLQGSESDTKEIPKTESVSNKTDQIRPPLATRIKDSKESNSTRMHAMGLERPKPVPSGSTPSRPHCNIKPTKLAPLKNPSKLTQQSKTKTKNTTN